MHYSDLIGCPAFLFAEANKVHSLETVFLFFFNPNRYNSVMWPQQGFPWAWSLLGTVGWELQIGVIIFLYKQY